MKQKIGDYAVKAMDTPVSGKEWVLFAILCLLAFSIDSIIV